MAFTFTTLEKTDLVLIYGEVRGYSEVARQIYGERYLYFPIHDPLSWIRRVEACIANDGKHFEQLL
jgi:hypothetical protein